MDEYYFWPDVHEGLKELYLRTHFANNLGGFFPAIKANPELYINKRSPGKYSIENFKFGIFRKTQKSDSNSFVSYRISKLASDVTEQWKIFICDHWISL